MQQVINKEYDVKIHDTEQNRAAQNRPDYATSAHSQRTWNEKVYCEYKYVSIIKSVLKFRKLHLISQLLFKGPQLTNHKLLN